MCHMYIMKFSAQRCVEYTERVTVINLRFITVRGKVVPFKTANVSFSVTRQRSRRCSAREEGRFRMYCACKIN